MDKAKEIAEIYQNARNGKLTEHKSFLCVEKKLREIYDEDNGGLKALVETMSRAVDICCAKAKDAEAFAKGFSNIIAGEGDSLGGETVAFFEKMLDKFPNSTILAEYLSDIYEEIIEISKGNKKEEYERKLEELFKSNPALTEIALQWLYTLTKIPALVNGKEWSITEKEYAENLEKARLIYEAHPGEHFVFHYAKGLVELVRMQGKESAAQTISRIGELLEQWSGQENIAAKLSAKYTEALQLMTRGQDEKSCAETITKIESKLDDYPNHPHYKSWVAINLSHALMNYSFCEGVSKEKIIIRLEELADRWEPAKKFATEIAGRTS